MPPFPQNGTISAFLGVTEIIEILQPLIYFFDKVWTSIQMRILLLYMKKIWYLANRKPMMCIALAQTCLFHLLKHVYFSDAKNRKII